MAEAEAAKLKLPLRIAIFTSQFVNCHRQISLLAANVTAAEMAVAATLATAAATSLRGETR